MKFREELNTIYEEMWRGSDRDRSNLFRLLIELFIPFSKRGFSFVKVGEGAPVNLIYHSPNISLSIISNFEMQQGIGDINFCYSRADIQNDMNLSYKKKRMCKHWIVSSPSRSPYFHYYLEGLSPEATKASPEFRANQAFEKLRNSDKRLKELRGDEPARTAAFESFCWEYYGERLFRLFYPENQSERDALAKYAYAYYKANYSPEGIKKWEDNPYLAPPWKICL